MYNVQMYIFDPLKINGIEKDRIIYSAPDFNSTGKQSTLRKSLAAVGSPPGCILTFQDLSLTSTLLG